MDRDWRHHEGCDPAGGEARSHCCRSVVTMQHWGNVTKNNYPSTALKYNVAVLVI